MKPIVCVGETLIDFLAQNEIADIGQSELFRRAAGGAVSNVAVGVARLGGDAAFVGAIGNDSFGRFLLQTLARENVNIDATRLVAANTTLAFVARGPAGARDFEFVRGPGADSLLLAADLDANLLQTGRVVHFGGVLLSAEPGASASMHAAMLGHEAEALVTFDPNARPSLFPSPEAMKAALRAACAQAHIVKCSSDDLQAMSNGGDGAAELLTGITTAIVVTDGAHATSWYHKGGASNRLAPPKVTPVDTTGAGDAFMAALLVRLVERHDAKVAPESLDDAVRFANAAGAFACLREGAIPSLPRRDDVEAMLRA